MMIGYEMNQNEKYREFFNKRWHDKSTYELIIDHNAIRVELAWQPSISEITAIEAEVIEQILTEREVWFPKLKL